jgi:D-amino peptidase
VANIRINGINQSEGTLNAAIAGHFGVPVVFVSGDDVTAQEIRSVVGERLEAAVVKRGIDRTAALSIPVKRARELIRQGVKRGVENRGRMSVHRVSAPIRLEIDFTSTASVLYTEQIPGVTRTSGRTIEYHGTDFPTIYKLIRVLVTLGARLR